MRASRELLMEPVKIIGGGLAGAEAAWQMLRRGIPVRLFEMRPAVSTEVHRTDRLAELVCSNSLGSMAPDSAAGLLKEELRRLDSLIMKAALRFPVPAGKALAVDGGKFSQFITDTLTQNPLFTLERQEVRDIPEGYCILASGPLTSPALAQSLQRMTGEDHLFFYDAVAPVVELDSVDMTVAYRKDRYEDGGDYINCPMDKESYLRFYDALVSAQRAPLRDFEKDAKYFEGCMPVEVLASRGLDTLRFGPLRPVGLEDPRSGARPYAAVQLRQDNLEGTLYNMVGFQTNLRWSEQERVFRLIPGLERAEFVRMGVMHRNIYVDAPRCLDGFLRPAGQEKLFLAGQLAGVEGYLESTAMGAVAALGVFSSLMGLPQPQWPQESAIGALLRRLRDTAAPRPAPVNATMGIFPPLEEKIQNRRDRNLRLIQRGREKMDAFAGEYPQFFS